MESVGLIVVFMNEEDIYKLTIQDFKNESYRKCGDVYLHSNIADLDRPIFRYMQFQHLLQILKSKKLYISNRSTFPDKTEHGWKENPKDVFPLSSVVGDERLNKERAKYAYSKWKKAYNICISCWTYDVHSSIDSIGNENYLMWKSYGFSNVSCRIETTIRELVHSIENKTGVDVVMSEVSYVKPQLATGNIQKYIFEKNPYYQYENEVRLCVLKQEPYVLLDINPSKIIKEITLSPFINNLFSNFLIEKFQIDYPELSHLIRKSHIMEY